MKRLVDLALNIMKNIKIACIALLVMGLVSASVAQSPKARTGTFALTNATIETVTKGTIANEQL